MPRSDMLPAQSRAAKNITRLGGHDLCAEKQNTSTAIFRTAILCIAACITALIVDAITTRGQSSISAAFSQSVQFTDVNKGLSFDVLAHNNRTKARCESITVPENLNYSDPKSCSQFKSLEEAGFTPIRALGKGITASSWLLEDDESKRNAVAIFLAYPSMIESSILVAQRLCGAPSLMQLLDVVCHAGVVTPIFEQCAGRPLVEWFYRRQRTPAGCSKLSNEQLKSIIKQLYQAVDHLIKSEVRHADLDFTNVIYDEVTDSVCIIDYGNSQWYIPGYNIPGHEHETEEYVYTRTIDHFRKEGPDGTRPFLAEEDTIAFAAMAAGLLGVPVPYQPSEHNFRPLASRFVELMGRQDLEKFVHWNNFTLPGYIKEQLGDLPYERADLHQYQNNACNKGLLTDAAIDLLDGLLQYSVTERMKCFIENLSLDHPFFSE